MKSNGTKKASSLSSFGCLARGQFLISSAATVKDRSDEQRITGFLKSRRRIKRKIIFLFSLQMSGMLEKWLHKLVSALQTREKDANVVVVDWLPLAHQLYIDAVNNTRVVGQKVAGMLDWLQVSRDEREPSFIRFFFLSISFLKVSRTLSLQFLRKCRAHVMNFEDDKNL